MHVSGAAHIARTWDSGRASIVLDSHGYRRLDEGLRDQQVASPNVCRVSEAAPQPAYIRHPPSGGLRMSDAIAMSGAALNSRMGTFVSKMRITAFMSHVGLTLGG